MFCKGMVVNFIMPAVWDQRSYFTDRGHKQGGPYQF